VGIATIVIALAAIVQAGSAVILVRVTQKYVSLTKDLLDAATSRVTTEMDSNRTELRGLAGVLLEQVGTLQALSDPTPDRVRTVAVWTPGQVHRVLTLCARLPQIGEPAPAEATEALSWIEKTITRVQNTPRGGGEPTFDRHEMKRRIEQAASSLARLMQLADRTTATAPSAVPFGLALPRSPQERDSS
jgi:hypothetical protein